MSLPGTLRSLVTLVLVVSLVTGGAVGTGVLETPSVTETSSRFASVNATTTTVATSVGIHNPYPLALRLGDLGVEYAVAANGVRLASGARHGLTVERGNSTLAFRTYVDNERIPEWWEQHVRDGETSPVTGRVAVHLPVVNRVVRATPVDRTVETDVLSAFRSETDRPVHAGGVGLGGPTVVITETDATWGEVNETATPIRMTLTLHNPNAYPVVVSKVGYDIRMNDVRVGHGETRKSVTIPPGETRTVPAKTVIRTDSLDEWWVTHVRNGQTTTVEIDYRMQFDLSGAGLGTVTVPLDTMRSTFETDFFGTKSAED